MMFHGRGSQVRFGERPALSVQVQVGATRAGRVVSFTIARATPGETLEVRFVNGQGSVVAQGVIDADANGDVTYQMPWPYPSGEYRIVVRGPRSDKGGSQSFRV